MKSLACAAAHLLTITVVALCVVPTNAAAAPPANDNYLDSAPVNRPGTRLPREDVKDSKNTAEATTQTDLFVPRGTGGGPEPTVCGVTTFGNTIWYDFYPDLPGTAEIQTAGFDAVVAVYEFSRRTARLGRLVRCSNVAGVTEDLFVDVERGKSYTVQIGGVSTAAGPAFGDLQFTFEFFADRDRDGVFDALDDCPRDPGRGASGCPPVLRANPRLRATATASGIRVISLSVAAPRGARVTLRCRRGCGAREKRTARRGAVALTTLRGLLLPAGATIDIAVTRPRAIGSHFRYKVTRGSFKRIDRCLRPGSQRPRRRCR